MQMNQFGLLELQDIYYSDYSGPVMPATKGTAVSRSTVFEPDPNVRAPRRIKPKGNDLLFSGVDISRLRSTKVYKQTDFWYRASNYNRHWMTTSANWLGPYFRADGSFRGSVPPDPTNACIAKLRNDLVNYAQALGEYKKTATLLSDSAKALGKSIRYASQGRIFSALSALGKVIPKTEDGKRLSLRKAWLLWHFGIETLAGDVADSVDHLVNGLVSQPVILRASKRTTNDYKIVEGNFVGNFGPSYRTTEGVITRTIICYAEVDNSLMRQASDHGFTSPVGLAWELMYASWLVDYFINVGEWLSALDFPCGVKRTVKYETIRYSERCFVNLTSNSFAGTPVILKMIARPQGYHVQRKHTRTKMPLAAVPPVWRPKLGMTRLVTALAFLTTVKVGSRSRPSPLEQLESNKGYSKLGKWLQTKS